MNEWMNEWMNEMTKVSLKIVLSKRQTCQDGTNMPEWIIHIARGLIFPGKQVIFVRKPHFFRTCIYIVS